MDLVNMQCQSCYADIEAPANRWEQYGNVLVATEPIECSYCNAVHQGVIPIPVDKPKRQVTVGGSVIGSVITGNITVKGDFVGGDRYK